MYSLKGMKEILAHNIEAPIDNFYVSTIEPMGLSFATYPLLTTQYAGFSDIGKNVIDWSPFIIPRYTQKLNEIRRQ